VSRGHRRARTWLGLLFASRSSARLRSCIRVVSLTSTSDFVCHHDELRGRSPSLRNHRRWPEAPPEHFHAPHRAPAGSGARVAESQPGKRRAALLNDRRFRLYSPYTCGESPPTNRPPPSRIASRLQGRRDRLIMAGGSRQETLRSVDEA